MEESTSREKVLKKIRNALIEKSDNPFSRTAFDSPIYPGMDDSIDLLFAESFTRAGGKFIYCENRQELLVNISALGKELNTEKFLCGEEELAELLKEAGLTCSGDLDAFREGGAGITSCEALVARSGSILVSSRQGGGRKMSALPDIHVVLGKTSQLVAEVADSMEVMQKKYGVRLPSQMTMVTGPSRTADIEKTLVMGAHGPRELYLLLLEDLI